MLDQKFKDIDRLSPNFRKEYVFGELKDRDLEVNPFLQFGHWFEEALEKRIDKPNAMTLATASRKGRPAARIVLLKGFDEQGFIFYTNYESPKARDLAENSQAVLLFHWSGLEKQVRIDGRVKKISKGESLKYFRSRPRDSQLSAWISKQSQRLKSRKDLEKIYHQMEERFHHQEIPLPAFWGGYRLVPGQFEFWQGRKHRLNDRYLYLRRKKSWQLLRLFP